MAVAQKIHTQMRAGSWIRKMFEEGITLKKKYGEENVFDLSLGNPVMEPPRAFQHALRRLATERPAGMHRYMPNAGLPETRAAVARQLAIETGLPFTANEVIMTVGAGGGLNVVFKTILNPGDEVLVFSPYFVEYRYYIDNHGGESTVIPTDSSFNLDLKAIEAAISPRTRALLINSPNNPTGVIYTADTLAQLGELLARKEKEYGSDIYLVSDEPYRKLIYDGLSYPFIYAHHPHSIAVTSHSKDLGLPGERIGYIAVNPGIPGPDRADLIDGLTFCNRTLGFVNAPALMQRAVASVQDASVDIGEYQRLRDMVYNRMTAAGYQMVKPQGAFYFFPKSPLDDDLEFSEMLLEWRVLVVPGRGFGAPGYFRLVFCTDDRTLEGALAGFEAAAQRLGLAAQ
jgi:aspartate aminotransferase